MLTVSELYNSLLNYGQEAITPNTIVTAKL